MLCLKRITALAAVACLLISIVSCGGKHKALAPFSASIEDSQPRVASVHSEIDSQLGLIGADYTASYSNGKITVDYTKNSVSAIGPETDEDDLFPTESGTVTINRDGTVTGKLGALVKSLLTLSIVLDGDAITYEVNGSSLSFTVTADNTERVFGVNIGYPVSATIVLSEDEIASVTLTYTAESGDVTVECEYSF